MSLLLNPPGDQLGRVHALLHGVGRHYEVRNFRGPLSIKTVRRGRALWRTNGRERVLSAGRYLLIAEEQPYDIEIDSHEPVETFCVFFQRGFAEDVCRTVTSSDRALLSEYGGGGPLQIIETIDASTPLLTSLLRELAEAQRVGSDCTDLLARVAIETIDLNATLQRRADAASGTRAATRAEILRRVLIGRDLIESSYDERLALDGIASAATMSPFHFHRAFRSILGVTPLEYLTRLRLEKARELLTSGGDAVQEVATAVGFDSLPTFTALFRKRVGTTPGQYRAQHRKIG